MSFKSSLVALALLAAGAERARAGASLYVDDAAVTPSGQCQVESWARTYFPSQELTAVPACSVAGNEFSLGFSRFSAADSTRLWSPGFKHVLRDAGVRQWSVGLSLGASWDARRGRWVAGALNLPASIAFDEDDRFVLHANLGWGKADGKPGTVTGGLGAEFALDATWHLLAEVYGDPHGTAAGQFGLRRSFGEDLSIDLLAGHEAGLGTGPWLALGVNLAFAR